MFTGFTPETVDFLWGLRMNNNRAWFQPRRQQYIDTLYEPMKALGQDLFAPFADRPGAMLKVSRIYRDARLHHPDPYKEGLWLAVRLDMNYWAESPCLFFDIHPEGVSCGFSLWRPTTAAMENFRRKIAADPEPFLRLIGETERAAGLPVTAECYKKPKPFEDPALEPYFRWKADISCIRSEPVSDAIFGPALGQRVGELFEQLTPLLVYFASISVQ